MSNELGPHTIIKEPWYTIFYPLIGLPIMVILGLHPLQKLIRYQQPVKFVVVGGTSTLVTLGVLWVITDIIGLTYMISNLVAAIVGTLVWFTGNALWTFQDRKTEVLSIPKTIVTRAVAIAACEGLLIMFVEIFSLWYVIGAFIATIIVTLLQYIVSTKWIWRRYG